MKNLKKQEAKIEQAPGNAIFVDEKGNKFTKSEALNLIRKQIQLTQFGIL